MKKALLLLAVFLAGYFVFSTYSLGKHSFICPIDYKGEFMIRIDGRGNGLFGSPRSGRRLHKGVDLLAEVNTPVLASRSGTVIAAKRNRGMGNYIIIRHSIGLITIYGHLSRKYVVKNQFVHQGDVIGAVGKTGNARYSVIQPHLHFEIRKNGVAEDPLDYLE
ncbi:MAG: M23 family metallopeptidase [Candidatus Omnitrophica bacterium]|nr:M23 family metallopeptidase [Candidatus Omnitrophota bacterium]